MATVEELRLSIKAEVSDAVAKLKQYERQTGSASKANDKMRSTFAKLRDVMQGPVAAIKMGISAISGAVAAYDKAMMSLEKSDKSISNLKAVWLSTGNAVGMTIGEINRQTDELAKTTLFDDDTIRQAQSVLLTFKQIKRDAFEPATKAAADMATVIGMDLQQAMTMVGKALNDPTQGIGALRRVGVQLTASQTDMVKKFMEVNDVASAQGIILGELESQFGGAAEAATESASGGWTQLKKAIEDTNEEFARLMANKGVTQFFKSMVEGVGEVISGENAIKQFGDKMVELEKIVGTRGFKGANDADRYKMAEKFLFGVEDLDKVIAALEYKRTASSINQDVRGAKRAVAEIARYNNIRDTLIALNKEKDRVVEKNNKETQAAIESAEAYDRLQEEIAAMNKAMEIGYGDGFTALPDATQLKDQIKAIYGDLPGLFSFTPEGFDPQAAAAQRFFDDYKEGLESVEAENERATAEIKAQWESAFSQIGDTAGQTFDAIMDWQENQNDAYIANLEAEMQAMKDAGYSTVDMEEHIKDEKNRLGMQEFNAKKLNKLADITMSTASAVAEALTLGPVAGPIAAGLISALGGVQFGLAAAQTYTPLAKGGIVTAPTHALIGEAGPEAVIPLKDGPALGTTINNYYISGSLLSEKQLDGRILATGARAGRGY